MSLQGEMAHSERSAAVPRPHHPSPHRVGTEPTSLALSGSWERSAADSPALDTAPVGICLLFCPLPLLPILPLSSTYFFFIELADLCYN